jgi:hypothetical protein
VASRPVSKGSASDGAFFMPFSISIFKRLASAYFFVGNIKGRPEKESAPAMP